MGDIKKLWDDAFLVCVEESQLQTALQLTEQEYSAIGHRLAGLAQALLAAQTALEFNPNAKDVTGMHKMHIANRRALSALHEEIRYLFNYLVPMRNRDEQTD